MAEETQVFKLVIEGAGSAGIVEEYKNTIQELFKAKEKLVETDAEYAKQVAATEKEIEKQNEALNKTKNAIEAEEGSIAKLRESNKKLTAERNALSTKTEEGRQKIKLLNDQIDANNAKIKDNVDAYTKQKINIGNYSSALDKLIPGLSGMTSGIQSTTKASLAFIATPIGAVIAALGLALGAVVTFLKNSAVGMDFLEDASAALGAVMDVLVDRVVKFVGGLIKIATGDWSGFKDIKESVSGIADEMEREIKAAKDLAQAMRDLEDAEIRYKIKAAETENQIKLLMLQARNRTLAEKERIRLLDLALEKEKELNTDAVANANEQLRIDNDKAARRLNIIKLVGETELDFAKRILEAFEKASIKEDALRDKVLDSFVKRTAVENESIALQEKILNQQDALVQKAQERAQKENEAREKAHQDEIKRLADLEKMNRQAQQNEDEQLAEMKRQDQEILDAEVAADAQSIDSARATADAEWQIQQDLIAKKKQAIEDAKVALQASADFAMNLLANSSKTQQMTLNADLSKVKAAEQQKLEALENRFKKGAISEEQYNKLKDQITQEADKKERELKKKGFESQKKNQIAATIISTLQSAVNAFQSLSVIPVVGTILGAAAAAAAVVFGFKQVQAIRATQFSYATGGLSGTRIMGHHGQRIYRSNGDNILATVKTGEVIANERQQKYIESVAGSDIWTRAGIPGFDGGGLTSFSSSAALSNSGSRVGLLESRLDQMVSEINDIKVVLPVDSLDFVQGRVKQVEARSTPL